MGDPAREWWIYSVHGLWVGHLRVPVTPVEYEQMPSGCAVGDAGEAGPLRPRTR